MRTNLKTLYINREGAEPLYLLTQRSPDAQSTPNMWSLIGGVAGDDEGSDEAAQRLSAERVGLTGHKMICVHEWVQTGMSIADPAVRSLRIAETTATVADLRVAVLQTAAFFPLSQIPNKAMADTTRVGLHLVLPDLIPTLGSGVRAVLFDLSRDPIGSVLELRPDAVEASIELHARGYVTGIAADADLAEYRSWPTGLESGARQTVDLGVLRSGRPNPDLYRAAATKLGLTTSQCVHVSTDRLALVAASAAGAVPIRLDDPDQPEQNPQIHAGREPWPVIQNLTDLTELLPELAPGL